MSGKSIYDKAIRHVLMSVSNASITPERIEETMRYRHPTLDHLSGGEFEKEVKLAIKAIQHDCPHKKLLSRGPESDKHSTKLCSDCGLYFEPKKRS